MKMDALRNRVWTEKQKGPGIIPENSGAKVEKKTLKRQRMDRGSRSKSLDLVIRLSPREKVQEASCQGCAVTWRRGRN